MDTDIQETPDDQAEEHADDRFFGAHDWFDEPHHLIRR
jgi:hypothetical protein